MSGVTADIPAAPDEPSGQATENTSVASVHTSDEAAQASESTQHSKNFPTEEDVLNFIYGCSSSTDKPCTDDNSDDLDPYMTSPRATPGSTAQTSHYIPQDPKSFASFGDRGTTASVNAYGQIMQITKFLGAGRSGFLCTDSWDTPKPFCVRSRAKELMEKSSNYLPYCGFTLLEYATPKLDFICDRWPRFTGNIDGYIVQIQCYASHGKIFQQCILEEDLMQESPKFQDWLETTLALDELFILDSDIHIRDLDWRDKDYPFNNASYADKESYKTYPANDHFSLVRTHKGLDCGPVTGGSSKKDTGNTEPLDSIAVELVITAFLNGRPQRLKSVVECDSRFCIDIPKETATAEFRKRGRLEVIVAYKLQLARKDGVDAWKSRLVPASHLTHMREAFSARGFQDIQFSTTKHLDFAIRRNLEHIISVCCVPVPSQGTPDHESEKIDEAIALTCGDMSGHILVNSASFFAFEFLVAIHQFLRKELSNRQEGERSQECQGTTTKDQNAPKEQSESTSNCQQRNFHYGQAHNLALRIHAICKGHINWIFKTAQANGTGEHLFGPNYWASGQRIQAMGNRVRGTSRPASTTDTDTAFQLIKAERLCNMSVKGSERKNLFQQHVKRMVHPWFMQLKKAERRPERGPYAFARSTDDVTGNDNYYLEDHVWIWKALASIESIGSENAQISRTQTRKRASSPNGPTKKRPPSEMYSSKEAQRHVLKRFTVENSVLKRRMLAVFRSSSDSRFMLRSRDTALFYAMDSRLFNIAESDSLVDVWRSTLEAQSSHEKNQTAEWRSPLRYALALLMAINRFQINRSSVKESFNQAEAVLFGSSSANGLFPGLLDPATKDPEIFQEEEYRDTYWNATFEIPYLLWIHAKKIEDYAPDTPKRREKWRVFGGAKPDPHVQEAPTTREIVVTTKNIPFNNLIDKDSIVELQDEWLYNEPDFLDFTPRLDGGGNAGALIELFKEKMIALCKNSGTPDVTPDGLTNQHAQSFYDYIDSTFGRMHGSQNIIFKYLLRNIETVCTTHWQSISQQDLSKTDTAELISPVLFAIHATLKESALNWFPEEWKNDIDMLTNSAESDEIFCASPHSDLKYASLCAVMSVFKEMKAPLKRIEQSSTDIFSHNTRPQAENGKGVIVDVQKQANESKKGESASDPLKRLNMLKNEDIMQKLNTQRPLDEDQKSVDTPARQGITKKRLIWLPCADMETAMICCLATPDSERESMLSFFERHATYDKFFFDDTTAASNTWKTELQLSFYQLHTQDSDPGGDGKIRKASQVLFSINKKTDETRKPDQVTPSVDGSEANKSYQLISRAAMGFRFNGDFFDRYWTCHFIEYRPIKQGEMFNVDISECEAKRGKKTSDVDDSELREMLQPRKYLPKNERRKQPWRQRKVLELILFDRILEEITTSTDKILEEMRSRLKTIRADSESATEKLSQEGTGQGTKNMESQEFLSTPGVVEGRESLSKAEALEDAIRAARSVSTMKGENYLSFSKQSQALEQILRVLDDDLGGNLEQIERWRTRDKDRAPEKPRWTRNDERRYRTTITKMLASNDRRVRELRYCRSNVQSLKASLESTREYIRDDLNLRSAEDVRLFTYVTATFLPISFATSIFSMGGFPGKAILGSMIGLATVALLLTCIALVYDKKLAVIARHLRKFILHLVSQMSRVIKASSRLREVWKPVANMPNPEKNDGDEEPKRAISLSSIFGKSRDCTGHDPAEAEKGVRKRHAQ